MEKKYVVRGMEATIFPASVEHSEYKYLNPTSAGFVRFKVEDEKIKAEVYGESKSLKLKTSPEDAMFIEILLNSNGG